MPDFEATIATHVDTKHLHNHIIVNSVSYVNGKKLHRKAVIFKNLFMQ
ncbi:relaxase/mobilization nuclease domain-containing protein [uncultured Neglectibacter sp.]